MNEWVYASIVDIEGRVHTLALPKEYQAFFEKGIGIDGSSIPGFASVNKSDLVAKPDMNTFVPLPWSENESIVLLRSYYDKRPFEKDSKNLSSRMDQMLRDSGYSAVMRPEIEFFVIGDSPATNNHYLEPPYFDETLEYRKDVSDSLQKMGIPVRYHHHENATGQVEVELQWIDGVERTCDWAIYTKIVTRWVAKRHGIDVSYIPKLHRSMAGNGMHVHVFLKKGDKNIFLGEEGVSQEARYFIGGVLEHIRAMSAITNPTITSYKRLSTGLEAPRYIAWGYRNRSTLIRVPASMEDIEVRNADSSANPYLAFPLIVLAGLDGIKKKIEPPEAIENDLYELPAEELSAYPSLPGTLEDAIEAMESDTFIKNTLGSELYDTFVEMKRREIKDFHTAITDWEIQRYSTL